MKDTTEEKFPGFDYPVTELAKYIRAGEIFTILLKEGSIIHPTFKDYEPFEKWLLDNNIQNIKQNEVKKEPGEKIMKKV